MRNLPVIADGKVMGIVNVNDISDFSFSMEELGGKKAYMKNISQRKGLPQVLTPTCLYLERASCGVTHTEQNKRKCCEIRSGSFLSASSFEHGEALLLLSGCTACAMGMCKKLVKL